MTVYKRTTIKQSLVIKKLGVIEKEEYVDIVSRLIKLLNVNNQQFGDVGKRAMQSAPWINREGALH